MSIFDIIHISSTPLDNEPTTIDAASTEKGYLPIDPRALLLDLAGGSFVDPKHISHTLCLSDDEFGAVYVPVLLYAASSCQLVPASEFSHHTYNGGLLRHSAETGCAMMGSLRPIYLKSKERHPECVDVMEASIRAMGFALGVMHDIGKVARDMDIHGLQYAKSGGYYTYGAEQLGRPRETLYAWLKRNNIDLYQCRFHRRREVGAHSEFAFSLTLDLMNRLSLPLSDGMIRGLTDKSSFEFKRTLEELKKADAGSVERDREQNWRKAAKRPQLVNALLHMAAVGSLGDLRTDEGSIFLSRAVISQAAKALPNWEDWVDVRGSSSFAHDLIACQIAAPPEAGKLWSHKDGVEGVEIPSSSEIAQDLLREFSFKVQLAEMERETAKEKETPVRRVPTRVAEFVEKVLEYIDSGEDVGHADWPISVSWEAVFKHYGDRHPRATTLVDDLMREGLLVSYSKEFVRISGTRESLRTWLDEGR